MTKLTSPLDPVTRSRKSTPRLLVSVRSRVEAIEAIAGGVDILDVKEPANGPLGMANASVIGDIADAVRREVPISVALGELIDWTEADSPLLPKSVTFAKVGLSGLQGRPDWQRSWQSFRSRCDEVRRQPLGWVAVAYADAINASSPELRAVLQAAVETDCAGFLIDTYRKQAQSLLDHMTIEQLCEIAEECRRGNIFLAIAGRLTIQMLPEIRECQPDIFAIRSAACREGDRQDAVESSRVAAFRAEIRQQNELRLT